MSEQASTFAAKSTVKAPDREHRRKINFNMARYNAVVPLGKQQFTDLAEAKQRAKNIKWHAIETLDKQLESLRPPLHGTAPRWCGPKQQMQRWKK
jgi:L-lactate dehydrogenase complex protein LldF